MEGSKKLYRVVRSVERVLKQVAQISLKSTLVILSIDNLKINLQFSLQKYIFCGYWYRGHLKTAAIACKIVFLMICTAKIFIHSLIQCLHKYPYNLLLITVTRLLIYFGKCLFYHVILMYKQQINYLDKSPIDLSLACCVIKT